MNVASLEPCRELYELSGWDDTEFSYHGFTSEDEDVPMMLTSSSVVMHYKEKDAFKGTKFTLVDHAAYDLGYLLRKLPDDISIGRSYLKDNMWTAASSDILWEHDNPEDAAAKLAIELFKQGVLTKESA